LIDTLLWSPAPPTTSAESIEAQPPESTSYSFAGTTGAAGLGSLVGGVAGLYLGEVATNMDEDLEDVFMLSGAILGSWIGGWQGGATVSRLSGPSALGSALGVASGGFAFAQLNGGYAGIVAYAVTHGLVTALVTVARR
jgi:hypothetical protein